MGRHDYHFVSHWRIRGTVDEVTAIFRKGYDFPCWWPAVYLDAQEIEPGDEHGLGAVTDLYSKGWLPYTIRWRATAVDVRHPYGFTIETSGDFVGRGTWTFEQDGDWVNITYDWRIRAEKPLLQYGTFLLRRIYAFNHRWAMQTGQESLRLELARRRARTPEERALIPPPPGPTPSVSLPLAFRALGLAGAGAGLLYVTATALGRNDRKRRAWLGPVALVGGAGAGAVYALRGAYTGKQKAATGKVPPYVRGYPVVGVLSQFLQDPPHYINDVSHRYGDIVSVQLGPFRSYILNHPAYAQHVLEDNAGNYEKDPFTKSTGILLGEGVVVVDGEFWQSKRRLVQPVYGPAQVGGLGTTVTTAVETMLERWQVAEERGASIDVAAEMQRLMLEISVKAVFGVGGDIDNQIDTISRALITMANWFDKRSQQPAQLPPSLPLPANRRMREALHTLDAVVYAHILERRRSKQRDGDLLSMLLSLRDGDTGEPITDKQARDEIVTALVSINQQQATLAWILYALAKHSEAAGKISAELAVLLDGRTPSLSDLPELTFTTMFIQEAMRLYPANWSVMRTALQDDTIERYHIPAKSLVIINSYGIHHHPSCWPDPYQFDPERFTLEHLSGRPRYAYQPFSHGPRQCLGKHFAMMTSQLVVATLVQRFKLHLLPEYPVEPKLVNGLLQPCDGVVVRLERQ